MYQLIQYIACFSLYDYSQYISIALYKIQAYSRYRCISWSTQWGARSVYCYMGIDLYIGAFAVPLQKSSECIFLYHVWLYRTYTLRMLQATDHYQTRCGWMRTRIRFRHRLAMRSRIHLILAYLFSLSSIVQRLQASINYFLFGDNHCSYSLKEALKRLKFRFSGSWTHKWPPNAFRAFWSDFKPLLESSCDWFTPDGLSDWCFFKQS